MKGINIFKYLILAIPVQLLTFISLAQSFQYQPDKPGKFIFDNRLDKCPGVDVFTVQNKLTSIFEWVRLTKQSWILPLDSMRWFA